MISSKKFQFIIILISACVVSPLFAAEPNEPNKPEIKLKFEMSNNPQRWLIVNEQGKGPVMPEFMAEFYIKSPSNIPNQNRDGKLEDLLQTNIGKTLSQEQKLFIETSSSYECRSQPNSSTPIDYKRIRLYSLSRDDAEKMAKAFIEQINEKVQNNIRNSEKSINNIEQIISEYKKDLTAKEAELKKVVEEYGNIKEKIHQFSSDEEAVDLAKKSIIEMDRTFNDINIELASIRERIRSIEKYQKTQQRAEILAKLDSMYVDLMIELSGLEAQLKVVQDIYAREQKFVNLFTEMASVIREVDNLGIKITDKQKSLKSTKDYFRSSVIPADVYLNTVTIYPVTNR